MITKDVSTFETFIGIIEDLDDPLQQGRCRIRVFNHHDQSIDTKDLDWAKPIIGGSQIEGVGISPTWYKVGTWVVGFYIDGKTRQQPLILGALDRIPGNDQSKHSVSQLARGKDTFEQKKIGPEPKVAYAAEYPHNKTITTEAGHVVEIDDTPGNERIHIRHKAGTYVEINKDGRIVFRSGERFDIVDGKQTEYVTKDREETVKKNDKETVDGNQDNTVKGNRDTNIGGNDTLDVGGNLDIEVVGSVTVVAGAGVKVKGTTIKLN
jgi:hypothetical protein